MVNSMESNGNRSTQHTPDYQVEVVWGNFVRRLNRFAAEVDIGLCRHMVHIPSSGRMGELLTAGAEIALLYRPSPGRKTQYTAAFVRYQGVLVSIDSHLPNRLVHGWLQSGALEEFPPGASVTAEVSFGTSRFDFFVTTGSTEVLVEVKSVTLVENGVALFPDAPTDRGTRHVRELIEARDRGIGGMVIFLVQREDAECFAPYKDRDPDFALALQKAARAGVRVAAYRCSVREASSDTIGMRLVGRLPVDLMT